VELDESTRPRAVKQPDAPVTPAGRRGQLTLVAIHNHLRHEMRNVVRAVESADADAARSLVNAMTMKRNYEALGAFCGNYCRLLNIHHSIEDRHMFTEIGVADPTLELVLTRLGQEHEVIHEILVNLDNALVRMTCDPDQVPAVLDEVHRLDAALTSHLDYEESELLEPIGRLSIEV
jgi:hemerythrin-like domain-containing protein